MVMTMKRRWQVRTAHGSRMKFVKVALMVSGVAPWREPVTAIQVYLSVQPATTL